LLARLAAEREAVSRTEVISSMILSKQELRQRFSQLNALMCEWDPIEVMTDPNWPRDEYECLVGPLLTLLQSGASDAQIAGNSNEEELAETISALSVVDRCRCGDAFCAMIYTAPRPAGASGPN